MMSNCTKLKTEMFSYQEAKGSAKYDTACTALHSEDGVHRVMSSVEFLTDVAIF